MPKSSFPLVDWERVTRVGFDLDGALYDEFDFIEQAYGRVASVLSAATGTAEDDLRARLLSRWIDKGSSYPHIFSEALSGSGLSEARTGELVGECLALFHSTTPELSLSPRVRFLLDGFARRHPVFLVTDGGCTLQHAKIAALGLGRWFSDENIAISGCVGVGKPDPAIADGIAGLRGLSSEERSRVVYFGDRDVDEEFARRSGVQFVRVACMRPVETTVGSRR